MWAPRSLVVLLLVFGAPYTIRWAASPRHWPIGCLSWPKLRTTMRTALLASALSCAAGYTAQVDSPLSRYVTPSWALASNAVPHWSNPVREEPGFGLSAVDPALSMALRRQSGVDDDGTRWEPGMHKMADGHRHTPPKHNQNHNNREHTQKQHVQGRQHKLKEQFDDGAWKPDVGNFEQASGDDGQEEGGDEELEGGKQAKKRRVKKVELQFDCAAVDPDTTDDSWCSENCNTDPPYCPAELCSCKGGGPETAAGLPSGAPAQLAPAPSTTPKDTPKDAPTLSNCEGAECAGLGAGAGTTPTKKVVKCISLSGHCMPCGEPIPEVGGCNKNMDQTGCQADQCEWLGEFGPGCESGEAVDSGIGDDWCMESCNAEPANCPEEKCECEGGNPMINNAGVERPPGMSAKENEVWTQNEERKAYSEREAVAKAKDVEREKIEEETRKRGEEREAAVEAARIAKEQETTKQQQEMAAQKAAEQKEREDGAREREAQAADRNAEAAEISKAANEKIAKTADAMKTQAESMKAAGEEMKRQAEKMQKEADKMQKEAVEAAAAASRANEQAMSANNAAMPSPSPGAVPAAAVAPTYTTEQDMEEAMAQAEKEKEAARKLFEDAAQANAVPVKREQEQEPAR